MTSTIRLRPTLHRPAGAGPGAGREVASFALIGIASTLAYVVIYAAFRTAVPAVVANAAALLITALGNTAANRRYTFGIRGRQELGRDHVAGLAALGVALALSTAALVSLSLLAPAAPRRVETSVLLASQVLATAVRFLLLRTWLRRPARTIRATGTAGEGTK